MLGFRPRASLRDAKSEKEMAGHNPTIRDCKTAAVDRRDNGNGTGDVADRHAALRCIYGRARVRAVVRVAVLQKEINDAKWNPRRK